MNKFCAVLNDGSYINVRATKMEIVDNTVRVYNGTDLVAIVDISTILTAHLSDKKEATA